MLVAVAAALNVGGLGTMFAGFGGGFGSGFIWAMALLPNWMISGGGPTLTAGWCIILVVIVVLTCLFHRTIGTRYIYGAKSSSGSGSLGQTQPSQNSIPISAEELQSKPKETTPTT